MPNDSTFEIPSIADLGFKALLQEKEQLEAGLLEAMSLPGIARSLSVHALLDRLELVNRGIQAFEKVTVRTLQAVGISTCQYTRK